MSMKAVGWLSSKLGINISGRADDGVDNTRREEQLHCVDDNSFLGQSKDERSCSVEIENNNQILSEYDCNKANPSSDGLEDKLGQYWNQVHSIVNNYVTNLTNSKNSCKTTFGDLFNGVSEQKSERVIDTQFNYSDENIKKAKLTNSLSQRELEEAHLGINTEVDDQGLPVNKNWYFFDTALNRWNVSPDAPESVRRDYEKQLWEEEQERLGLRVVEPPPPPPSAKMQTSATKAFASTSANQMNSHTLGGAIGNNDSVINNFNHSANTYYPTNDPILSSTPSLPQMPQRGLFTSGTATATSAAGGHTHRRSAPQYAVPDYFASTPCSTDTNNHTLNVNAEISENNGCHNKIISSTTNTTTSTNNNISVLHSYAINNNGVNNCDLTPQCNNFAASSTLPERSLQQTLPLPPPPPPLGATGPENNKLLRESVQQRFPSPPTISGNESNKLLPQTAKPSKSAIDNTEHTSTDNPFIMPHLPMNSNLNTLDGTNIRESSTSNLNLHHTKEEQLKNYNEQSTYANSIVEVQYLPDKISHEFIPVPISNQVNTTFARSTDNNINTQNKLYNNYNNSNNNNNYCTVGHNNKKLLTNVENRIARPGENIALSKQSVEIMLGNINQTPNSTSLTFQRGENKSDCWNESANTQQVEQNKTYFAETEQQEMHSERHLSEQQEQQRRRQQQHLYKEEQFHQIEHNEMPLSHTETQMMTRHDVYSKNDAVVAHHLTNAVNSENEYDVNKLITNSDVNPFIDNATEYTSCHSANYTKEAMNNKTTVDMMSSQLSHTSQSPQSIQQQQHREQQHREQQHEQQIEFMALSQPHSKPIASLTSNLNAIKNNSLTDNNRLRSSLPPPPSFKPFQIK